MSDGCKVCMHSDHELVKATMTKMSRQPQPEITIDEAAQTLTVDIEDIEDHVKNRHSLDAVIKYRQQYMTIEKPFTQIELTGYSNQYLAILGGLIVRMNNYLVAIEQAPGNRDRDIKNAKGMSQEVRACVRDIHELKKIVVETEKARLDLVSSQLTEVMEFLQTPGNLCEPCEDTVFKFTETLEGDEEKHGEVVEVTMVKVR